MGLTKEIIIDYMNKIAEEQDEDVNNSEIFNMAVERMEKVLEEIKKTIGITDDCEAELYLAEHIDYYLNDVKEEDE